MRQNFLLAGRFCIALIFIISGVEKLLSPSENFFFVLQEYRIFPDALARLTAVVFPWAELGLGLFVLLGLWLRLALLGIAAISGALILVVAQAIIRQLPIDNCGCFGNLIHLPLKGVILLDITTFTVTVLCLKDMTAVLRLSLDRLYGPGRA